MTIEVNYIDQGKGIEVVCSGAMHGKDIIASQLTKTPRELANVDYMLVDYSEVIASYVSTDEVKTIAANDQEMMKMNPGMLIVAVVPSSLFRLLSNLWLSFAEANVSNLGHFETRDEAESWIETKLAAR